jgi:hypothetical protein
MNNTSKFWPIVFLIAVLLYFTHQEKQRETEMAKIKLQNDIELSNQRKKEDDEDWERAENHNTRESFEAYVERNPTGRHLSEALAEINKWKEQERLQKERERHEKIALKIAALAGDQIITKAYQDGINKTTTLKEWNYTPADAEGKGIYNLKVELNWNGNIVASNYYAASGIISIQEDGTDFKWAPTYINETLAKYLDDVSFAAIAIGVLANFSSE